MVLDPTPQPLPVHFFGSRPQPPTSPEYNHTNPTTPAIPTHRNTLQHTATHCNTLQYTATIPTSYRSTPSVLQYCSVLPCVAVCCSVLQCVVVCCSVLQCLAVCCSVLMYMYLAQVNKHKYFTCIPSSYQSAPPKYPTTPKYPYIQSHNPTTNRPTLSRFVDSVQYV